MCLTKLIESTLCMIRWQKTGEIKIDSEEIRNRMRVLFTSKSLKRIIRALRDKVLLDYL